MRVISFVILLVCVLGFALGQEVEVQQPPQQQQQQSYFNSSPDADLTHIFSDADPEEGFYPGKPAHVVVGFKNQGTNPITFKYIAGALYYHLDHQHIIENYTAAMYDVVVKPAAEFSFTYPFRLHPMLSEGEYGLEFAATYVIDSSNYASLFYNQTIQVLEPKSELQPKDVLQYGLIVAVFALGIFALLKYASSGKKRKATGTTDTTSHGDAWARTINTVGSPSPKTSKKNN